MLKLLALAALLAAAAAAPADYPQIKNLRPTGATLNTVTLSWDLDVSQFVPVLYTLHVNGVLTIQFFHDGSNSYTVTGLNSCNPYTFDLTASYDGGEVGETANAAGSTQYETPGAVGGLTVAGSVVSWTAPANSRCVEYYTVCYESTETDTSNCAQGVLSTSYDLGTLSACDALDVTVSAVGGNITGPPSAVHVITEDGVPGEVRDLEVVPLTDTSVLLAWNPPLVNPACAKDYAIVYGPTLNFTATGVSDANEVSKSEDEEDEDEDVEGRLGPSGQSITATLDNLVACTDFRFGVAAVSAHNEYSPEVVVYLSTNDSAPGILPDVTFDATQDSITISWGDVSTEACLGVIQICYVDPIEVTYECVEVPNNPNTWTVSGLGACREYEFSITGVSPGGSIGESIVAHVPTKDRAPGPVQNLALANVEMTSLTLTYEEPIDYPECADQYIVRYKNMLEGVQIRSTSARAGPFTDGLDGLDACAIYDIGVSAVSPTGIEGAITSIVAALKQGTPDAPTDATLVSVTESSLTVLWFAPTTTRFCVDTYEVRVSEDGSGPTQLVPILDFNQEVLETFPGLKPCTSYMVQIRSKNSETDTWSPFATVLSDAMTQC